MNQHDLNTKIAEFIQKKDALGEDYSAADRAYIQGYEGAGGQGSKGAKGQGILYEYFTPAWLCKKMWELAVHHGYSGGAILEPACGTGRLLADAPKDASITAFEINPISARITEILNPKARVYNQYFETAFMQPDRFTSPYRDGLTWLADYPFSLVISNPPYGKHSNQYSSYFTRPKMKQMEFFFIYWALTLLESGGLLVYLTSSNIMRSGISYQSEKELIAELSDLIDAYRLPPVFKFSAVPTDILIFRKK